MSRGRFAMDLQELQQLLQSVKLASLACQAACQSASSVAGTEPHTVPEARRLEQQLQRDREPVVSCDDSADDAFSMPPWPAALAPAGMDTVTDAIRAAMVQKTILKKPSAAETKPPTALAKPGAKGGKGGKGGKPPTALAKPGARFSKPVVSFEASRNQFLARAGLKGVGQTHTEKIGKDGKAKAKERAEAWLREKCGDF